VGEREREREDREHMIVLVGFSERLRAGGREKKVIENKYD
jgi:hypothetical protein